MDYFSLVFTCLYLAGQGIMHIAFISRLTGKKQHLRHFIVYLLLLGILEWFGTTLALPGIFGIPAQLLVLYGMSRFALGNRRPVARVATVLAIYISQFSIGAVNSVEAVIFPHMIGEPLLCLLILLATLAAFILCACCYMAALKFLSLAEGNHAPDSGALLFPGLFFFTAELYILHTAYSVSSSSYSPQETGRHGALLFLQILGLAALFGTLYVYQRLCRSLQAQAALQSMAQAARAQKIYITETQIRYRQTKAFRHDIKNHLSVLEGLLSSGKVDESRDYLQKLETASDSLSFPCQTGNPVVDILLREKLGLAKEINTEISLLLPRSCGIDDFDLCVIFANALDNAITACLAVQGAKNIRIRGERQGDFYRLTFENTCPDRPLPPPGTGLSNIKTVAEKYRGTLLTEKNGACFRLDILLNSSLQTADSSAQNY